jgi:hypothetical protein
MDVKTLALKVMELPSAKLELSQIDFEALFQLSLDASVLVMKNASSASKAENIASLLSVVNEVLDLMKEKTISTADQVMSTKKIVKEYDNLKLMADNVIPVVFSHLPLLNSSLLSSLLGCFSLCKRVSSGEEVVKRLEVVKEKGLEKSVDAVVAVEDKTLSLKDSPVEKV